MTIAAKVPQMAAYLCTLSGWLWPLNH